MRLAGGREWAVDADAFNAGDNGDGKCFGALVSYGIEQEGFPVWVLGTLASRGAMALITVADRWKLLAQRILGLGSRTGQDWLRRLGLKVASSFRISPLAEADISFL